MFAYSPQIDEVDQQKNDKNKKIKTLTILIGIVLFIVALSYLFFQQEQQQPDNEKGLFDDCIPSNSNRIRVSEFGGGSALLVALAAKAYGANISNKNNQEQFWTSLDAVLNLIEHVSEILGMDYYQFNNPQPESEAFDHIPQTGFCNMINYPVSQTVSRQSNCRDFRAESQYYDLLENSEINVLDTLSQTYSVCDNAIRNSLCLSAFPGYSYNNHTTCVTLCNEINSCAASAGLGETIVFHCPLFCELTIEKENPCFYRYYSECIYYEPECRDSYFQSGWTTDAVSDRFQEIGETNSQRGCILAGKYHYRCCQQSPTAQEFMMIFNRALHSATPSISITSSITPSVFPSPSFNPNLVDINQPQNEEDETSLLCRIFFAC